MTINRRTLLKAGTAAGAITGFPAIVRAQSKIQLKISHYVPPVHGLQTDFIAPWAKEIETRTNGQVTAQIFAANSSLGQAQNQLDQVLNGVVDVGFGSSAQPGLIIASRLRSHDDFTMTGGAGLPVGIVPAGQRDSLARQLLAATKLDGDGHFDPAPLIRTCLRQGSSSRIEYQEPGGKQVRMQTGTRPRKIGRNETCPCGSGRKYKHCCLNRF